MEHFFGITEGIVKDTNDPQQNGRLKIWCPSLDGENIDLTTIPWAEYATPFGGVVNSFKTGRNTMQSDGPKSYGMWALPKIGAEVFVFLLNGDPNRRCYFASKFGLHRNRSIPAGRNKNETGSVGPFTDSYDPLQPAYTNLREAFQNKLNSSQAQTRGAFERQAAQNKTEKDGKDGYADSPVDSSYLDPQTYCLTTPGGHSVIMNDAPDNCRVRLKTTEGNQIILDDTNERIYVSTANGKTWIELDEDGHIHCFAAESFSVRSGKDINLYADRDLNIEVGRNINAIALSGEIKATAKSNIQIRSTTGSILSTACNEYHICVQNGYFLSAEEINNKSTTSIISTTESGTFDVKAAQSINLETDQAFNAKAATTINIKSDQGAGMSFGTNTSMVAKSTKFRTESMELDAGRSLKIGAVSWSIYSSGNGASTYKPFGTAPEITPDKASTASDAESAKAASGPPIIPGHEPWYRPASARKRNKYWRE